MRIYCVVLLVSAFGCSETPDDAKIPTASDETGDAGSTETPGAGGQDTTAGSDNPEMPPVDAQDPSDAGDAEEPKPPNNNPMNPGASGGDLKLGRIAVGRDTSCWLREDGAVYCWGRNDWKQFGAGEINGEGEEGKWHADPVLTEYAEIDSIGLSRWNSFGITQDGRVWGAGQVGYGVLSPELETPNPSGSPALLASTSTPLKVTDYASGYDAGCALAGGRVYCQGRNDHGAVGDGSEEDRSEFVDIGLTGVSDITAGYYHTCAVRESEVVCWGDNEHLKLGSASAGAQALSPVVVEIDAPVVAVSAGSDHTCARTVEGEVYCWGRNWNRMVTDNCGDPCEPTKRDGLRGVKQLAANSGSTCALLEDSTVQCWGEDFPGLDDLTGVAEIASGHEGSHYCALIDDGDMFLTPYCWGLSGGKGQLGRGTFTPDAPKTPEPIRMPSD